MHASKMKILFVLLFISINFGIVFLQNDVIKDTNDNNHSTDNKWLNVCGEQSFSTCRCPVINQYNYMRRNSNTTGNDREHVSLLSNTCHQLGLPTDECSSRDIQQYANTFCVNDTTTKSYTDLDGIVKAACERFGISDLHCSCPQLYHRPIEHTSATILLSSKSNLHNRLHCPIQNQKAVSTIFRLFANSMESTLHFANAQGCPKLIRSSLLFVVSFHVANIRNKNSNAKSILTLGVARSSSSSHPYLASSVTPLSS